MPKPSKPYNPHDVEEKIYRRWERAQAFRPASDDKGGKGTRGTQTSRSSNRGATASAGKRRRVGKPFVIVIPPPNITGSLHMGHALQDTIMDVLTRYHRMLGDDSLWVPGTDHAGIATQNVVEKQLRKEGITRQDLGREAFLERVWTWKEQYGKTITEQIRRLGCSCDWTRERFTMDPGYVRAVQEAFIHYAQKGLIYRGDRIVNWCPRCASSISDLEVKYEEREGMLYTIRYPINGKPNLFVAVATTRPETLIGDAAVAVHPDDERYTALIGATVELPLVSREIPLIADAAVDRAFGTGAVKVTPAHDHGDADIGERHHLPVINVIGEDGHMTAAAGAPYAQLSLEDARTAIVEDLKRKGFLEKEETVTHRVTLCDRCGTVIQPLTSQQWFVKMAPLAAPAIKVAEEQLLRFTPERWGKAYLDWLRGVKDWCVSRQLWWGHRLPVWYCNAGSREKGVGGRDGRHIVFSAAKPRRCPDCGGKEFVQDPDVLDTWFSSALWPFAVFGWPEATADLRRFYPTSVLTTAQEILHLWVGRMVFSGLEFMSRKTYLPARQYGKTNVRTQIPFRDVIIHQTVLNLKGQRMSKSLGTGVDPIDLIHAYGADATRFGLLSQVQQDQQALRFDEHAVRTGRNVVNKLWNIGRFLQRTDTHTRRPTGHTLRPTPFDRWILTRLDTVTREVTDALDVFRFGDAMRTLHAFLWDDVADWYIEALKVDGMASISVGKQVVATLLRLLHPFTPFVTEALWSAVGEKDFLMCSSWPRPPRIVPRAPRSVELFQKDIRYLRSLRSILGVSGGVNLAARIAFPSTLQAFEPALRHFAGLISARGDHQEWVEFSLPSRGTVAFRAADLSGLPITEQKQRLEHQIADLQSRHGVVHARIQQMQQNNAPAAALEIQHSLLTTLTADIAQQEEALATIARVVRRLSSKAT